MCPLPCRYIFPVARGATCIFHNFSLYKCYPLIFALHTAPIFLPTSSPLSWSLYITFPNSKDSASSFLASSTSPPIYLSTFDVASIPPFPPLSLALTSSAPARVPVPCCVRLPDRPSQKAGAFQRSRKTESFLTKRRLQTG
eukprot:3663420-Pleurochrysis_carterae.AAC.1